MCFLTLALLHPALTERTLGVPTFIGLQFSLGEKAALVCWSPGIITNWLTTVCLPGEDGVLQGLV